MKLRDCPVYDTYYFDDGSTIKPRNPLHFFKESFSYPPKQPFPKNYYDVSLVIIAGNIGSGKSTLNDYLKEVNFLLWPDMIDFFDCEDIFSTIEAVRSSEYPVHYITMDDMMRPGYDARQPMRNINTSQKYAIIRHLINTGILEHGYLILSVISQFYKALDLRMRDQDAFSIFKTYSPDCESKIKNEDAIWKLRQLRDKVNRCKDNTFRRIGIAVDCLDTYTPIIAPDKKDIRKIDTQKIKARPSKEIQMEFLVKFLLDNSEILFLDKDTAKGYLFEQLYAMRNENPFIEVTKSDFAEIISIAKKKYREANYEKEIREKKETQQFKEELRKKQWNILINTLLEDPSFDKIPTDVLKGYLEFKLDELNLKYESIEVFPKDFSRIINRAKSINYSNNKIPEEKNEGYLTNPKKITTTYKIEKCLEIRGMDSIANINKIIDGNYETVKSILHKHPNFVRIERGIFTLKGSKFDKSTVSD